MPAKKRVYQPGERIGEFVVVSTQRRDLSARGYSPQWAVHVRCPACEKAVFRLVTNLRRAKTCGCLRTGWRERKFDETHPIPMKRFRPLFEEAARAFGMDYRYTVDMMEEYHKIKDSQTMKRVRKRRANQV